jgi:3-oxoacyl-(acyl-carrier-protein) synthase
VGISGLGFVTCIGNDSATVVENLRALRHGLARFDFLPGIDLPVKVAGTIKGFETRSPHYADWRWPERYVFKRETLRSLPPHGLHALCAAEQAIAEARLSPADLRDEQTGLFTASAGSPFLQRSVVDLLHTSKGERVAPLGIVSSIAGTLSFNLGAHYGIRGAVCGFASACTSTAHALGYAYDEIALGRLARVLVIGGEDLSAESIYSFHGMRALSRNPDPARASRPFDVDRDGFVGTGGAAAVLLEEIECARRRQAPIFAEMLGWGQAADGHNVAISDPDGRGLAQSMRRALAAANVAPAEVSYVNAHATSTPIGDRSEARALHAVFTAAGATPAVSSTKALTGHGLSMAAAMETGFCALALRHGFIPGQAHLAMPDPACEGLHLPATTIPRGPDIVVKNSSGFGGSNVTLVLQRWSD